MNIRQPLFADDKWYPKNAKDLRAVLSGVSKTDDAQRVSAFALMLPHAGFAFSARTASKAWAKVQSVDTVIILAPYHNIFRQQHTPPAKAIWATGAWRTPIGDALIDEELAAQIQRNDENLISDIETFNLDQTLELQIPFIQVHSPNAKIVPIQIASRSKECISELASAISSAVKASKKKILIVASTDMNHFESASIAKEKDEIALLKVDEFNGEGLVKACAEMNISMCGCHCVSAMLSATKILGATKIERVDYCNSSDITGDEASVVAYASVIVK